MSVDVQNAEISHNRLPIMNDKIISPLTQEEISAAKIGSIQHNGQIKKKPIIPVPMDAPEFNFEIPGFGGKPSQTYPYHIADGQLVGYIARWDIINQETGEREKKILPVCYCELSNGQRAWRSAGIPSPRPLYRLPEILACADAPVVICEGEKTASAAQTLLPDFVATTPMHGAQSPHKTDLSVVKNRKVIIATDHDDAGEQFGDAVYDLCLAAGAESIFHLSAETVGSRHPTENGFDARNGDVPQGYDLADALQDGWTAQDISRLNQLVPLRPYIKNSELRDLNGNNRCFRLTPNGVEYAKEIKDADGNAVVEWRWFCSYLAITHQTRDAGSNNWGRVLELIDNDGKRKEYVLPMAELAGDGTEYRQELLSRGLRLAPKARDQLHSYITTANPKKRATCVAKPGWHDTGDGKKCFVMPAKVYGAPPNGRIVLQQNLPPQEFKRSGSLSDWQDTIGRLAGHNPRLVFALSVALSGTVLGLLGEENFGFHFSGGSSVGKTTALEVAASAWGLSLRSWRTTDNAAESLARQANDTVLFLDELSQADAFSADALAYMLGNGISKARSNRNGAARPVEQFRLAFLSSGETGLAAKMQESGKSTKAGQSVRFIEIPADAGKGFGLFDCLHEFSDANKFSIELKQLSKRYSGAVADHFLTILSENTMLIADRILESRKSWVANHVQAHSDGQVHRVAQKFALVAAVGELATSLQIFPWQPETASNAALALLREWISKRGGTEAHEMTEAEGRLRRLIAEHGSSRFEAPWSADGSDAPQLVSKAINRAGFKRLTTDNVWEYFILPDVFDREIIAGLPAAQVKAHLAAKGIIARDPKGKFTASVRVPGYKQARLYHIPSTNLGGGGDAVDE